MKVIEISEVEAINLANHLEFYILQEVRDGAEDYDNIEYLINLVHVYERCKAVRDEDEKAEREGKRDDHPQNFAN